MQGNRASGWLLRGMETDRGCAERDITLHDWNVNYRDYVELFHTLAAEKFVITCHSSPASCLHTALPTTPDMACISSGP